MSPRCVPPIGALGLIVVACTSPGPDMPPVPAPSSILIESHPPSTPAALPMPEELARIRVIAGGDVLIHQRVKATARARNTRNDEGLSTNHDGFDAIFSAIAPVVSSADLAFVNLETPVAPEHHRYVRGEVFNAPAGVLGALANIGVDVVSFANNHTFDQGPAGILETLSRLEAAGIAAVGSGSDCPAAAQPRIQAFDGLTVAWVAITDLMNDVRRDWPTHEDGPCTFIAGPECEENCGPDRDAIHYTVELDRVTSAIQNARQLADAVIVSFHWGNEYTTTPLPMYTTLAPKLIDAGADVILGHHPHVLQPIVRHTAPDGRNGLIIYSLGNLVSDMGSRYNPAQHAPSAGHTRDGVLLSFDLVHTRSTDGRKTVTIEHTTAIPLWTENNRLTQDDEPDSIRVVPLASVDNESLRTTRWNAIASVIDPIYLPEDLLGAP